MTFGHDARIALQAAAALVNSAEPPDTLSSTTALRQFYADFEYTGDFHANDRELAEVRALRSPLRELLLAEEEAAAGLVNRHLREGQALPQLVRHSGWEWHIHAVESSAPLPTRILIETSMAMVDVIRAGELDRLSVCSDSECAGIVLDLSRNRSRKFCSTQCNNRNAVAAYRHRASVSQRSDEAPQ